MVLVKPLEGFTDVGTVGDITERLGCQFRNQSSREVLGRRPFHNQRDLGGGVAHLYSGF